MGRYYFLRSRASLTDKRSLLSDWSLGLSDVQKGVLGPFLLSLHVNANSTVMAQLSPLIISVLLHNFEFRFVNYKIRRSSERLVLPQTYIT